MRRHDPSEFAPAEASNILAAVVLAFFVTVFAGGAAIICNHEPVSCRAGSVEALFTDCEVSQ